MSEDGKLTFEEVIDNYRSAYLAANDRPVSVRFNRGWYVIGVGAHQTRHRARQVEQYTAELLRRAATTPNKDTPHG